MSGAIEFVIQNLYVVYQQVFVGDGCWFLRGFGRIIYWIVFFFRYVVKVFYFVVERKLFVRIERYVFICVSIVIKLIYKF